MDAARAGQVSLALELPDDQLATLANTGTVTVQRRSQLAYEQVTFNQADPNPLTGQAPLWKNDPALLQALRRAIHPPAPLEEIFPHQAPGADPPIPGGLTQISHSHVALDFGLSGGRQLPVA